MHSAEFEPYGKPHPGVFLSAASSLGVRPTRCLVFEDSPAGVLAAKAASMFVVAVPTPEDRGDPVVAVADLILSSLEELSAASLRFSSHGRSGINGEVQRRESRPYLTELTLDPPISRLI